MSLRSKASAIVLAIGIAAATSACGGYVVVDDYGAIPGCKAAVDDFRAANGIDAPLTEIDWTGVWWRRDAWQQT